MTRANDNDPKNVDLESDFAKPTTFTSNSQGEISVYEIDILSYGKPARENNELFTSENEKNLSDNPFVEALTIDSDLKSGSHEIHLENEPGSNESHHKFILKKKVTDKRSSLNPNPSKEKFASHLKNLIIETFIAENDNKIKNLIKNLKKLENESVHLHRHEHNHNHYYVTSSKARNIKNLIKIIRSTDPKKAGHESKEKKQQEINNRNSFSVGMPSTATYICSQSPDLTSSKIDDFNSADLSLAEPKNSRASLSTPRSADSFLGLPERKSDLITTHKFSETEFATSRSHETEFIGKVESTSVEVKTKNIQKLMPQKLLKPEYNELMESLKVLDKYLEPKVITEANTKISFIKCECTSENEDEEKETEKQGSGAELNTSTTRKTVADESISQSIMQAPDLDQNQYASRFSPKKSSESTKLNNFPQHIWAQHLKEELKDIKNRLRDLERLYSRKKTKCLIINLRNNDSELELASKREISVFSTKTYIVKADDKFSRRSTLYRI